MANFCKYCGKQLENGICGCAGFLAANPDIAEPVQQPIPEAQPIPQQTTQQSTQQNIQQAAGQTIDYQQAVDASKKHLNNSKVLFLKFLKNPMDMMSGVAGSVDKTSPIILGVLNMVIVIMIAMIKIPYLDSSDKFEIGFKIALVLSLIVAVTASIVFLFSRKYNPQLKYIEAICVFCLTTIPASILYIAAFLLSYFSIPLTIVAVIIAGLSWIILCTEATNVCLKVKKDLSFWLSIAILAVVMIITYAVGKQVVMNMINDAMSSVMDSMGNIADLLDMF